MKIIASDYDGTLNHGGITDQKREAIARWRGAGNLFGLVSGRGKNDLLELAEKNRVKCDFFLADNGAVICSPSGEVIRDCRCDGVLALPLVKTIFSLGGNQCEIHADRPITVRADEKDCLPGDYTLESLPDVPYFTQISTIMETREKAYEVTSQIRKLFSSDLNPLQNGTCIDTVAAGMNKAQGIYALLDILGAGYDDIVTVGDNINDTDMIAEFRSYAMENAVPSIKAIANAEIAGISELIEKELRR